MLQGTSEESCENSPWDTPVTVRTGAAGEKRRGKGRRTRAEPPGLAGHPEGGGGTQPGGGGNPAGGGPSRGGTGKANWGSTSGAPGELEGKVQVGEEQHPWEGKQRWHLQLGAGNSRGNTL